MANIGKVREEGEFYYIKELDTGRIWKRMIPYIGVLELENVILQFEQTFLKITMPLEFIVYENTFIQAIVQMYMTIIEIVTMMLMMKYLARVQMLI